jgi:CheY-like chemotaxis protein
MPSAEHPDARPRGEVLVIDDHPFVGKAIGEMLDRAGHRNLVALDGTEGIKAFQAAQSDGTPFSLVITDLSMGDVDGLAVAAAVKGSSPSTPVILLTVHRLDAEDGLPQHVDAVLTKPPTYQELRTTVGRMLSREPREH